MKIIQWTNLVQENQGILELIDSTYGNKEIKNPKYMNWQYNKNPQGKAIIVLCFDEKKKDFVIGQEPIISSELNLGKTCVKSSISLNSIVHPNYRRRGIFSKLVTALPDYALNDGIGSVYGVPNPNSHKAFFERRME